MPSIRATTPTKIRTAVRTIFVELTGIPIAQDGSMYTANIERARAELSVDGWNLYDWARCIFLGLSTGRGLNTHPLNSLAALRTLVEDVEQGVCSRMRESREQVIGWILDNYSLKSLQDRTGIPVFDALQEERHAVATQHAPTQHAGHAHHGVSLPMPHVPPAPQQHSGLPPMLAGVTSPVLSRPSIRYPPIVTREEEEEERSLAKSRRDDAHLGYGASMTPRKAAIYGLAGSGRARRAF